MYKYLQGKEIFLSIRKMTPIINRFNKYFKTFSLLVRRLIEVEDKIYEWLMESDIVSEHRVSLFEKL